MANNLSAFLAQNAKQIEKVKYVASKRFLVDGVPVEWQIGCVTAAENAKIRQLCTKQVNGGKRGQITQVFDSAAYQAKIASRCTIYPSLEDIELQNSYGVQSAEELITTMLTPGEFDDYAMKVLEVNGFVSDEEIIEEAKN